MKNKKIIAGLAIAAALTGTIAGATAYFSGTADTVHNEFSYVVGENDQNGAIEIVEPDWVPEEAVELEPGELLGKDPSVISKVAYDGWVVVKVTSPKISADLAADENGNYEYSMLEAFSYVDLDETNYTLLKTVDNTDNIVYYYGYNTILENGKQTSELFQKIKMNDFAAVQSSGSGSVDIDAAIIQSVNPETGAEFTSVADAFATLGAF